MHNQQAAGYPLLAEILAFTQLQSDNRLANPVKQQPQCSALSASDTVCMLIRGHTSAFLRLCTLNGPRPAVAS